MIIRCKRCGIRFELHDAEVAFYSDRGWPKPKNCLNCRAERRIEKASPYYGIEEAFSNYSPCKKRRQRVHYRPYIAGGFR